MPKKPKNQPFMKIIFLIILLSFVFFIVFGSLTGFKTRILTPKNAAENFIIKEQRFVSIDNSTLVRMKTPAVNSEGKGVVTELAVEAMPGSGRALVDIDNLLFWADTQQSIRIARYVAGNISKINISNYDLVYTIHADASLIGGPSAGAAIAIATISALEGRPLNESVMITGTIKEDGSIGKVGEVFEKSVAVKEANATLFLVPSGQSINSVNKVTKECKKYGLMEICTIEQTSQEMPLNENNENTGIRIIEVENISEALSYFINIK
jgi:uncharacterized protein